jgi:zinc transport system permease protein
MLDDFLVRAAFAGFGVVLAAGPLGCFVLWRRMAYFGDATAHAAILGVALSFALSVSVFLGVLVTSVVVALSVSLMNTRFSTDTLLGVLAHGSLAIGLVIASLMTGLRVDLNAYLFGDILSVSLTDIGIIWMGAAVVLSGLIWRWERLLTATLNPDLAMASRINPRVESLLLSLALAVVVAVAIKVVGALLISALLIIPAATARAFSVTPERMAVGSLLAGIASVVLGLQLSLALDAPSGPSIIAASTGLFALAVTVARFFKIAR